MVLKYLTDSVLHPGGRYRINVRDFAGDFSQGIFLVFRLAEIDHMVVFMACDWLQCQGGHLTTVLAFAQMKENGQKLKMGFETEGRRRAGEMSQVIIPQ